MTLLRRPCSVGFITVTRARRPYRAESLLRTNERDLLECDSRIVERPRCVFSRDKELDVGRVFTPYGTGARYGSDGGTGATATLAGASGMLMPFGPHTVPAGHDAHPSGGVSRAAPGKAG